MREWTRAGRRQSSGSQLPLNAVAAVPLAEITHQDRTPRFAFLQQANRAFDDAEARNAGNPAYSRTRGRAPAPRADRRGGPRRARRRSARAVASAMAAPGTSPESGEVTRIIERLRAGESALAIARETGATDEPGLARLPGPA